MTGSFDYDAGVSVETITLLGVEKAPSDEMEGAEYDSENQKLVLHTDVPLTGKFSTKLA